MKIRNWGQTLKTKFLFLVIFAFLMILIIPSIHAEKFDRRYLEWKAKQQAHDEQLKRGNPNYYLAKPTVSSSSNKRNTNVAISSGAKVNINTANMQQLQQLNGVGAKKAQSIIDYRNQAGKFKSIDDLQNVKGIGPKMIEKNRAMLTF